jgi:signal transduction histidine kinase
MRWTFQQRLRAIVLVTTLTLATMALFDVITVRRMEADLNAIERSYLPLLDLGPAVETGFNNLSHSLQEAVAAQDAEALLATVTRKDELLARLNNVPSIVDREAADQLRLSISEWYAAAYDISTRLIRGETGEGLVSSIEAMQTKQRQAQQLITQTLSFDRHRLSAAFGSARDVRRIWTLFRTAVPLALTIAIASLALGMSRQVVHGMQELARGFERFGRGDFSAVIPVHGRNEVSEAAEHANRMAANLRDLNEALGARQADLERANRELEAFSYSVSHDLRAPLRTIDGFSLILMEDYGASLPDPAQVHLRRVRAAAQRMGQLIDDLLRLSRISRTELHQETVDISALARVVADNLAAAQPERKVDMQITPGLTALGDPALVRIVLENLMGNAWKFSSRVELPRVEVGAVPRGGLTAIFIRDNGAGFDAAYADKLFSPFQRLHKVEEFAGTGIGLATVQRIVHRHGGQVWAEGAVGKGATFYFALPSGAST